MKPDSVRSRRERVSDGLLLLLLAIMPCAGCHQNMYRPNTLPLEMRASPIFSANRLDMAKLDSGTVRVNTVYPGDVLRVSILTGADSRNEPDWRIRVDESGTLELPEVGPVQVANLDIGQAENMIEMASRERGVYLHPVATVTIDERRTYQVTVDGAVAKPGTYELPYGNCDLAAALAAAGGLTEEAGKTVNIRNQGGDTFSVANQTPRVNDPYPFERTSHTVADSEPTTEQQIDLEALSANGDFRLADGALVTVGKREMPAVSVVGLVRRTGHVEIPPGAEFRLLDAIAYSGGITSELADKVQITRKHPSSDEYVVIRASIGQAKRDLEWNIPLAPGDIVSVEDTPTTFVWRSTKDLLGTALLGVRIMSGF